MYFPITDHIGKPVLMLDSSRKVAGAADYDPFGHVNRVSYNVDTPHPYANSSNLTIGDFTQALGGPSVNVKLRVLFEVVDTEQDHATIKDYAYLTDGDTSTSLTGPIGGYHRGRVWSPWVQPSAGRVAIKFTSDATNCCPDGSGAIDCGCTQAPNFPYKGVTTEFYEYQRYQTGATPFWTPLTFPGQYHDVEVNTFENWNRYYDSTFGRYLQPEPMLQLAKYTQSMSRKGISVAAYSYANNNPLGFVDSDGLALRIAWQTRLWWSILNPNKLVELQKAIDLLDRPGCACALRKGNGFQNAPWDEKDVYIQFDPTMNFLFGAAGLAVPIPSVNYIYLDPGLEYNHLASVLAHEAGHFRPPYLGHDKNTDRFNGERICGGVNSKTTDQAYYDEHCACN